MAKFVRNLSSALFLNGASSGVGVILLNGCGRPDLEFEPAPFFFPRARCSEYKSPGHVTVPVPHIPFATRSGAMQSPDGSGISLYRFIRTARCGAFSASCVGPSAVSLGGKCRADDCRPLSCAGRALLCLAGTFMVRIRLGSVRRPLPERGGPAGSGRQKNRTGPTVPARWFAMPCVGKAGLRSESQNVQKLREALGLPGASAGRPYGTEPLLRGDGRPALSVSLF